MQLFLLILLGIGVLILQSAFPFYLKVAGVKPDLLTAILTLYAFIEGPLPGARLGFIYGLMEDILLGRFLGLNTFCRTLNSYLVGYAGQWLNPENPWAPTLLAFISVWLHHLFLLLPGRLAGFRYPLLPGIVNIIFPTALYTSSLTLILFILLRGGVSWKRGRRKAGE